MRHAKNIFPAACRCGDNKLLVRGCTKAPKHHAPTFLPEHRGTAALRAFDGAQFLYWAGLSGAGSAGAAGACAASGADAAGGGVIATVWLGALGCGSLLSATTGWAAM